VVFRGAQQTLGERTISGRLGVTVVAGLPWKHCPTPRAVIGTFPVAAAPACCANEAAGEAKTTKNAKAIFTDVFDKGGAPL
jgi:hypothetical protein